jgi:endoglucanase
MKKNSILLLACAVFGLLPPGVHAAGFVTVKGRQIVTPDGRPLLLRGINLGNWLVPEGYMFKFKGAASPRLIQQVVSELLGPDEGRIFWKKYRDNYITRDDIAFIKNSGMNSIRVPFNFRSFEPEDYPGMREETGFEMLDRVIAWCKEIGLYVILDMHCAPGGQTGDNIDDSWGYPYLFESPRSQERMTKVWREIAQRYCTETALIGYDLLNEPIAPYFDTKRLNPLLEPLYKKVVASIREVDSHHLIFLGGAQWNTNFGVFGAPFDPGLVYTFHRYWCDTTQAVVQEFVDFGEKHDVPLWMGESGENTDQWIKSFRNLLERNNIGWCFWPFKKMDATSCPVTFDRPAFWEEIVAYADTSRATFEQIRDRRPSRAHIEVAFAGFLENCRFKNCRINGEYLRALGMAIPPPDGGE